MKYIFQLFCCFLWLSVNAQQVSVIDISTNEPIAGVAVYNGSKSTSEISDFDGKIALDNFSDHLRY